MANSWKDMTTEEKLESKSARLDEIAGVVIELEKQIEDCRLKSHARKAVSLAPSSRLDRGPSGPAIIKLRHYPNKDRNAYALDFIDRPQALQRGPPTRLCGGSRPTLRAHATSAAQVSSGRGMPFFSRSARLRSSGSPGIKISPPASIGFELFR